MSQFCHVPLLFPVSKINGSSCKSVGKPMRVSVVIATKDRGPVISKTLESLLMLEYSEGQYEIVLVDNCSTPENRQYLLDYQKAFPDKIRYVREERIGLSNARNCGIHNSKGEIIIFTDDDVVAPVYWLKNLVKLFEEDPEIYAAGGKVVAQFITPPPDWIDKRFSMYLSSFDKGNQLMDLKYNDYPRGVNMAFRREAFDECGYFLDCFGRKGDSLMSYEEIELCFRIEKAGHRIVYAPDAEVYHLIRGDRLSREWFESRSYWQGRSEGLFESMHFGRLFIIKNLAHRIKFNIQGDLFDRFFLKGFVTSFFKNILKMKVS